jgi:hypothetical protein
LPASDILVLQKKHLKLADKDTRMSPSTRSVRLSDLADELFKNGLFQLMQSTGLLSAKASFQLICIADAVRQHEVVYDRLRLALVEKYGKRDLNGKLVTLDGGKRYCIADEDSFNKEFLELAAVEVEVPTMPFSAIFPDIEAAKACPVSPFCLQALCKTILTM